MLAKIVGLIVILVAAFAGYVALQPDQLRIERQATVSAPPAAVFAQISDLRKWDAWSPWAKLDPNAKVGFEGPATGKDAVFTWAGNEKIGEGRMTIVEARPDELVNLRVDFTKPFAGSNTSTFALKPEGNQTVVTWSMTAEQGFIGKAMCVILNGKKMLSDEMDKGLASLKSVAEGAATPAQ